MTDSGAKLWSVVWEPLVNMQQIQPHLAEHKAYLNGLADDGRLLASGPQLDGEGAPPQGRGLTLLIAPDSAGATAMADGDPLIRLGLRQYVLSRWLVHEGSLVVPDGASVPSPS